MRDVRFFMNNAICRGIRISLLIYTCRILVAHILAQIQIEIKLCLQIWICNFSLVCCLIKVVSGDSLHLVSPPNVVARFMVSDRGFWIEDICPIIVLLAHLFSINRLIFFIVRLLMILMISSIHFLTFKHFIEWAIRLIETCIG